MAELKQKIHLPPMPNYLAIGERKIIRKQDGFKFDGQRIDVADLTPEQIAEIGKEWAEAFARHCDWWRSFKEEGDK